MTRSERGACYAFLRSIGYDDDSWGDLTFFGDEESGLRASGDDTNTLNDGSFFDFTFTDRPDGSFILQTNSIWRSVFGLKIPGYCAPDNMNDMLWYVYGMMETVRNIRSQWRIL